MSGDDSTWAEQQQMFLTYAEKERVLVDPDICRVCGAVVALRDAHIDWHAREPG